MRTPRLHQFYRFVEADSQLQVTLFKILPCCNCISVRELQMTSEWDSCRLFSQQLEGMGPLIAKKSGDAP